MSKDNEDLMTTIMNLIVEAGSAKSYAMEAIHFAKNGELSQAQESLNQAEQAISAAHHAQTGLIGRAATGEKIEINLFMVHAQDHVMTAILAKDLAIEIVDLYNKISLNNQVD
ncbi:MAG: PTS lactose/cellobiose transporter subunit IIA [Clostridiales bacterium]|jgi:PTS system cellobiose-specific IIA component|nr:PTS lactose/cellobiose transporter subunit IIA [Clostridiales bacterium]